MRKRLIVQHPKVDTDFWIAMAKSPKLGIQYAEVRDEILYIIGVSLSKIKIDGNFTCVCQIPPVKNTEAINFNFHLLSITSFQKQLNHLEKGLPAEFGLVGEKKDILDFMSLIESEKENIIVNPMKLILSN